MDNTYTVRYDDGERMQDRTFTPDDVKSIEFEQQYITITYADDSREMWPWQSIIYVREE